jgi:hypothetical protein
MAVLPRNRGSGHAHEQLTPKSAIMLAGDPALPLWCYGGTSAAQGAQVVAGCRSSRIPNSTREMPVHMAYAAHVCPMASKVAVSRQRQTPDARRRQTPDARRKTPVEWRAAQVPPAYISYNQSVRTIMVVGHVPSAVP